MKSVSFRYAQDVTTMLRWIIGIGVAVFILSACQTPYPQAPVTATTADYDYHIGPLDTINVIVWRNPELSMSIPVRPDGKITTPLVDDLPALGKTPTELERDMEKALVKYIRDPVVTVVVTSFAGPADEQIRVIGEPGWHGNSARIFRVADGGKLYAVRLRDLVKRGDITANVDMRPGDILIIPQSWF